MTPPRHTLVCLHFLGGSSRTRSAIEPLLTPAFDILALDLPGFGDNTSANAYSVQAMATAVEQAIRDSVPGPFTPIGHSMGAKVAALVARRSEDGAPALAGLRSIVQVAGSPPCPEPIGDDRRADMLAWFTQAGIGHRDQAETFLANNVGAPLPPALAHQAIEDVLRMHKSAWRAWLEHGSREDLADTIGILRTPALLVAGEHDPDLGPHAQHTLAAPHYANARLATIQGARHLLPMERPAELAHLIATHVQAHP